MNRELLIATRNEGKVVELRQLLSTLAPVRLVSLKEAGVELEVLETGVSFSENAVLKALGYAEASGMLTLADDSGLEVDALNGEPGVHSARYGGNGLTHRQRYERLLAAMEGVEWAARSARFWAVVALARPGRLLGMANGKCEGMIAFEPAGSHGFGYDPVFWLPSQGRTMAQLTREEKQDLSHRGRAVVALRPLLKQVLASKDPTPD